jgi:hypothetical protein
MVVVVVVVERCDETGFDYNCIYQNFIIYSGLTGRVVEQYLF